MTVVRRASILLEVLLATAIFAFAGIVVLGTVDEALADAARADRRAVAMDPARPRLAAAEAGAELELPEVPGLRVDFRLEPSSFPGLALAVVEVFDEAPAGIAARVAAADPPRLAVLRQLVRGDAGDAAPRPEVKR